MTTESVTARQPYVTGDRHFYVSSGTCGLCGQLWPCQSILSVATGVQYDTAEAAEGRLYDRLKEAHYNIHPDHETTAYPQSCSTCAAIVAYRETQVTLPGLMPVVSCSECGMPLANYDLLAEHQVTVHEFTAQTEADRINTTVDQPLEDVLNTG